MLDIQEIYYRLLLIRKTEQKIEDLFSKGLLRGTTHGCIGQEALPVALSYLIDLEHDFLCSGHRAHGLAVAFTGKPELIIGEIMGKSFGLAGGIGGSQHIFYKNFYTNGITGGMVPVTTGLAFTLKHQDTKSIAVVVFGDGAMNEGYVMESFNLSIVLELPILFILENNGFAMSTSVEYASQTQNFEKRVKGFNIPYINVIANDYFNLYTKLSESVQSVRENRQPNFIEVITHRFCGHSKSDKRQYISKERDDWWKQNDCIKRIEDSLDKDIILMINKEVNLKIEEVINYCLNHE